MSGSEVAKLRNKIEQECRAMNLILHGYACVAGHQIINHKYQLIGQYQEQLGNIIGHDAAAAMTVEVYNKIIG